MIQQHSSFQKHVKQAKRQTNRHTPNGRESLQHVRSTPDNSCGVASPMCFKMPCCNLIFMALSMLRYLLQLQHVDVELQVNFLFRVTHIVMRACPCMPFIVWKTAQHSPLFIFLLPQLVFGMKREWPIWPAFRLALVRFSCGLVVVVPCSLEGREAGDTGDTVECAVLYCSARSRSRCG